MNWPTVRKANIVRGKNIALRNAAASDAAFILELRTDDELALHLSKTSATLADQVAWLDRYTARSDEAYFIIESADGQPLGTVRLYDARQDSFCWGSWIMSKRAPQTAAIESALIVYAYALDALGFSQAHFQVRSANERVWKFHERFGARRVGAHDNEYDYAISNKAIRASMDRYARYLPDQLSLEPLN